MESTPIKIVNRYIVLVFILMSCPVSSGNKFRAVRKTNYQVYTVVVPYGYGALSAYSSLPIPLRHAPYTLKGLNWNHLGQVESVLKLDFGDESVEDAEGSIRSNNQSIDPETFIKLFAHEFPDYKDEDNPFIFKE